MDELSDSRAAANFIPAFSIISVVHHNQLLSKISDNEAPEHAWHCCRRMRKDHKAPNSCPSRRTDAYGKASRDSPILELEISGESNILG